MPVEFFVVDRLDAVIGDLRQVRRFHVSLDPGLIGR